MRKVRILFVVSLLFLMAFTTSVYAANKTGVTYTALGDSIAFGTGGTNGIGYTDLFNAHLAKINGEGVFLELAQDGVTSADLLGTLLDPIDMLLVQDAVSRSDFITISIGGNDLLGPFMQELAMSVIPYYYNNEFGTFDLEGLLADLEAWHGDSANPDYAHFNAMFGNLSYNTFPSAIATFASNWALIIGQIRLLNPLATIYVNTGYNPFVNIPLLQAWVDPYVQTVNAIIMNESLVQMYDYEIVDVYTAFKYYKNPKKLELGDLSNLAEFALNPDTVPVPLHPTDLGYKFIFNLHKDLLK